MRETCKRITGTVFPSFYLFVLQQPIKLLMSILEIYNLCFFLIFEKPHLPNLTYPQLSLTSEQSNCSWNSDFLPCWKQDHFIRIIHNSSFPSLKIGVSLLIDVFSLSFACRLCLINHSLGFIKRDAKCSLLSDLLLASEGQWQWFLILLNPLPVSTAKCPWYCAAFRRLFPCCLTSYSLHLQGAI